MKKENHFTKNELLMFNSQDPIFSKAQMKIINRKTPEAQIEIKQDKSGHSYKSVKASYIKSLVMLVTGGNFDFEIKSSEFIPSTRETVCRGRLTIHSTEKSFFRSRKISSFREQFGQHYLNAKTDINGNTTTTYAADIGNGYKAACSDLFKKLASEFGFCWDIYGQEHAEKKKEEQPEPNHSEKKKLERLVHFLKECKNANEVENVYNKYLESSEETEAAKTILTQHMKRFIKK